MKNIGSNAFYGCESLENLSIPDSVDVVGTEAFFGCGGLVSLVIPDSPVNIGPLSFYGCRSLKDLVIPAQVESIGNGAFCGCESLESLVLGADSIKRSAFEGCWRLKSLVFTGSVRSIGINAFYDCESLESLSIPDSAAFIGEGAFYECRSLKSLVIPDEAKYIGFEAFRGCVSLRSLSLPYFVVPEHAGYERHANPFDLQSELEGMYKDPDSPGSPGFCAQLESNAFREIPPYVLCHTRYAAHLVQYPMYSGGSLYDLFFDKRLDAVRGFIHAREAGITEIDRRRPDYTRFIRENAELCMEEASRDAGFLPSLLREELLDRKAADRFLELSSDTVISAMLLEYRRRKFGPGGADDYSL